ncbi:hypothetical protein [Herbiconiux daphne]|uniref:Uncharacterized protein n=1 Tax=Herbiconiux daphne TaxID=2970914 RepID=A0ABT2H005_9MICO|nr:hypothetical protein [Herbiconiux daphne]MCS5732389.1 hypothetical protein [Herbiconiux daphne]
MAEQQVNLADWSEDWERNSCSALALEAFLCSAGLMSGAFTAQTIFITLTGAAQEGTGMYVGAVPEEIEDLYDETVSAASAANDKSEAWLASPCSTDASGEDCITLAFGLETAMDDVGKKFAAWAPYL